MYDRTAVVRPASQIQYDVGASSLTNVLHFDRKNATQCTKTRHFDI